MGRSRGIVLRDPGWVVAIQLDDHLDVVVWQRERRG